MKKLVSIVTLAACLLGLGATAAWAEPTGGSEPAPGAPSGDTAGQHRHGRLLAAALKVAADTIGISPDELRQAVRDGQTVAEVAQSKGVDPAAVVDAIVAAGNTKIDEAVASGKLEDAKAAKLKEKLPQLADRLVNHTGERRERRRERRQALVEVAAKAIGIPTDELVADLKSGKSIADIAHSKDVDVQKVVDAIVSSAKEKIDAAVESGKLPADKAEQIKSRLADRIGELVNRTFGQHRQGGQSDAGAESTSAA
jgi:uncharacterized protein (DUF433 family)